MSDDSAHSIDGQTYYLQVLEHVVYYVILAPHGNEQSDMLHRVFNYPELVKMTPQQ